MSHMTCEIVSIQNKPDDHVMSPLVDGLEIISHLYPSIIPYENGRICSDIQSKELRYAQNW